MTEKRKLYFFSSSYPYDIGEQWKTNELVVLKENFEITVIPFYSDSKKIEAEIMEGIKYENPVFEKLTPPKVLIQILKMIFSSYLGIFVKEFIKKKVYLNKNLFIQWITGSYRILKLSGNKRLMKILNSIEDYSILYFYWGRETSEIITILKPKKNIKIILRLHGFDLYEERNNNYIPYRSSQLKKTDIVLFVSQNGHNYLLNRYNKINFKGHISRLGTVFEGLSKASEDNILRVFSCSSVIPLKRVELIGQALFKLNIGVIWTHIGGGEQFDKLKNFVVQSPKNITVILKGQVKSSRIKRIYIDNCSDLFINVSTTEGVPVSIMEALSAGIPVLATNVGGTSELIDDKVGKLLPSELTANELSDEILSFYNLPFKKKQELRIHAFNRFKERCDAADLALKLSDYLSNI